MCSVCTLQYSSCFILFVNPMDVLFILFYYVLVAKLLDLIFLCSTVPIVFVFKIQIVPMSYILLWFICAIFLNFAYLVYGFTHFGISCKRIYIHKNVCVKVLRKKLTHNFEAIIARNRILPRSCYSTVDLDVFFNYY